MSKEIQKKLSYAGFQQEVKDWLKSIHAFPLRFKRSDICRLIHKDESTYCVYLKDDRATIPSLWDLLLIASFTKTQDRFFEILGRYSHVDPGPCDCDNDLQLLADDIEAFGGLTSAISRDLADKNTPMRISSEEALADLPLAVASLEAAQRTVDRLKRIAGKGE